MTFHNGKEMTSADVIWSLNLHRGEGSTSGAKGLTGDIADITADGPNAIVITLSKPNADLPYLLSDFHMLIVAEGAEDFTAGVFTSPYQVVEFNPGDSVITTRNSNYWKADRAHVDDVEILFVEDRAARINGLVTGELHMAQQIDEQAMSLIDQTPGVHIESHPSGGHSPILMHCDKAAFWATTTRSHRKTRSMRRTFRSACMIRTNRPSTLRKRVLTARCRSRSTMWLWQNPKSSQHRSSNRQA
ncbi:MAG: ABC transporter substrate-binding protein, partial [Albidovulum sp.]